MRLVLNYKDLRTQWPLAPLKMCYFILRNYDMLRDGGLSTLMS